MTFAEELPPTSSLSEPQATPRDPKTDRVSWWHGFLWSTHGVSITGITFLIGYFTIYATDTLDLSPGIVGGFLVAANIIGGAGALFSGLVVDRSPETRWGKARPFELIIVACWIAAVFTFSTPGHIGDLGKYIWVFTSYILLTGLLMPLFAANNPLFTARVFPRRTQYSDVSAKSGFMMLVIGVVISVAMPSAIQAAGKDPAAWSLVVVCIAIPAALIGMVRFLTFRESPDAAEIAAEPVRLGDILSVLRRNPYIWAVSAIGFFASVASGISAGTYYFRYIVGDIGLMGLAALGTFALLPVMAFLPKLARRYSVSFLLAASSGISILGMIMYGFAGANLPLIMVAWVLISFAALPFNFLAPILIIDNAAYNQWKGLRRLESVGGALFNFATTLGVAVAAGILGLVLTLTGYTGSRPQQSAEALHGIIALNSYIPACFALVAGVLSVIYHRLEKKVDAICAELDVPRGSTLN